MSASKPTLLVDADHLIFKAGMRGDGFMVEAEELMREVESLPLLCGCGHMLLFLSGRSKEGFRKHISSSYKENRVGARRPPNEADLRQLLIDEFETYLIEDLEADDLCAIVQTQMIKEGGYDSVATFGIDKDLLQIPGNHFRRVYNRDEKRWEYSEAFISKIDALYNHMWQTIVGDSGDNVKGAWRKGPKAAERALEDPTFGLDYWAAVCGVFADADHDTQVAIDMARLTFLLRPENYDLEDRIHLKPWTPEQFYQMLEEAEQDG